MCVCVCVCVCVCIVHIHLLQYPQYVAVQLPKLPTVHRLGLF